MTFVEDFLLYVLPLLVGAVLAWLDASVWLILASAAVWYTVGLIYLDRRAHRHLRPNHPTRNPEG